MVLLTVWIARRTMLIDQAKMENGWLCLKVQPAEALKWLVGFREGKEYEITQIRPRRSLDANAYAWVLLDKLSAALGYPKTELYRRYIKEVGGCSDMVCVRNQAVDHLCREWSKKGLGWQTDTMPSKHEGYTRVVLYYGSSTYDREQMSRLIDLIKQDCTSVGIEVKSEEEIESLLQQYERKRKDA